jgi:hypothetical protein
MRETQKFRLDNDNEVTLSEVDQGQFAEDKIMLLMETKDDSMALVLTKKEIWGIGRAMMHLGYTLGGCE